MKWVTAMNMIALFVETNCNVCLTAQSSVCVPKSSNAVFSDASISGRKGIIQSALPFRSYPLLAEEKLRRLSVEGLAVNVSEQVMQPVSVTSFQEQPTPPLVMPRLESNPPQTRDPEEDLLCIARTFSFLRESGWYWGSITASEAKQQLQKMPEGTFLVRDSAHPSYLFTLSVKTNRGPTNVRIEYAYSKFQLDSNCLSKPRVLTFPDVVSLIQHYVLSCTVESKSDAPYPPPVPLPPSQKEMIASAVRLKLIRPLNRKDIAPSLQHLCRLQINRCTGKTDQLPLPKRMKDYLKQYPFQL